VQPKDSHFSLSQPSSSQQPIVQASSGSKVKSEKSAETNEIEKHSIIRLTSKYRIIKKDRIFIFHINV
jgi:hypothetical protein